MWKTYFESDSLPFRRRELEGGWKNSLRSYFLPGLALILIAANGLEATKPCPPSPCASSGQFDRVKCRQLADWVAAGVITDVIHHPEGHPLWKDFAEFTFHVQSWEKGSGKQGQEIRFRVGWCDNRQELPKDISGSFRFYGMTATAGGNQYLHFERVSPSSK